MTAEGLGSSEAIACSIYRLGRFVGGVDWPGWINLLGDPENRFWWLGGNVQLAPV